MKVICKHNKGDFFKENELPIGVFSSTIFNLEVEKEYLVMGVMMSEKFIFYLLDEGGSVSSPESRPRWVREKSLT